MSERERTPTIGVVAISYNEERDLPGFLANLLPWVDEIVIVDDGSKDRTAEIAGEGGPKVKFLTAPRKEGEYYADQRNKGIEAAESDWLLHMDIDERVPPALAKEMLQAVKDPGFDAYRFRRCNYFLHRPMKGGGWADWNLVHLAKRPIFRFGGMFHESCLVDAPDERVGQLQVRMLHFNDESYEERLRKSATYQVEMAERVRKRGAKVGPLKVIAMMGREFLYKYGWKKGILDGGPGLISAMHSAIAVFRAHALVWDEQHRIERETLENEVKAQWERVGQIR